MTRQEAIERIQDHIDVHKYREPEAVMILEALDMAIESLKQPEIIHCRDCKHYQEQRFECELDDERWKPDDHCSYAERREE
jgi:hypothetical protein